MINSLGIYFFNSGFLTGKDKRPGNNVVTLVEISQPVRDLAVRRCEESNRVSDAT